MIAVANPNVAKKVAMAETVKVGLRNSPSGITGSSARRSTSTKTTRKTTPITKPPTTSGAVQSPFSAMVSAMSTGTIASMSVTTPGTSRLNRLPARLTVGSRCQMK